MKKHEEIKKLAYEIFEKGGSMHGRELDHWLEAERIIKARDTAVRAAETEAVATKKRIVERSDVRRHEAKKVSKKRKSK